MKFPFSKQVIPLTILVGSVFSYNAAFAGDWSSEVKVIRRGTTVVSYRAKLEDSVLIVEAQHAPTWHTYSMDNPLRAQKATGKEHPDTELPTRLEVTGGLEVVAPWYQSEPKDLTQREISWYTWGFEATALFASKVERVDGETEAKITINAQACDASSCQMVQNVVLTLPIPEEPHKAQGNPFEGLIEVKVADAEKN